MKTFLAVAAITLLSTSAFANMPPKDLDLGNESMSERKVLQTYYFAFGGMFEELEIRRVPFGQAAAICTELAKKLKSAPWSSPPTYGCNVDNVIVYSYDTRILARKQNRYYQPNMANHVLRHEFAHALFNWPANHPRACETLCDEETQ